MTEKVGYVPTKAPFAGSRSIGLPPGAFLDASNQDTVMGWGANAKVELATPDSAAIAPSMSVLLAINIASRVDFIETA
jgi:hypothetical protein